ncbi:hypothetical protein [Rhizobium halophytocola]|uniref:Uncharacterized protein n=1 Tax=Rhizobium halophytocola TaxID=735519 RepID=A0ABS4E6D8_9HYPH|nr:hypothetical protein [Rhizobium halophytocola]MBP1853515.1 hypothetical protein [Rhizobium halophytocola]
MSEHVPVFLAGEAVAKARKTAERLCLGKSQQQILQALEDGPYKDIMVLDPNADGPRLRAVRTAGGERDCGAALLHIFITHRPQRRWSLWPPRVSFFLRMTNGICRSVISVSEA